LQYQLYRRLREQILTGELLPGSKLPSTRALSVDLHLSRNTILYAFEQLIAEGFLQAETGSGTFVTSDLPDGMPRFERKSSKQKERHTKPRAWSRYGAVLSVPQDDSIPTANYRPFQPGFPALDSFPFDIWTRLLHRHRNNGQDGLLGYGPAQGNEQLRKAIASYLAVARGVRCWPSQVIIVSGTQQALDLCARLFLNPGDSVLMEEPGYFGAQSAFQAAGAKLVPIRVDLSREPGWRVPKADASARLAYLTPSNQFPLGGTMPVTRRMEWLEWAGSSGRLIIEDDYDSEFRYNARPTPALQSLDYAGCVLYLGTFSKVLFPALRLGYMVVPQDMVRPFVRAKRAADFHSPSLEQCVLADFIEEGHFGRHIRRMRTLYRERLEALLDAVKSRLGGLVEMPRADAGMHVAVKLAPGKNDVEIARRAAAKGISCIPLSSCYASARKSPGLLLGHAAFRPEQIRTAMQKLAGVLG
jgi:GntR family transcriptional regulator/MocR family aminotransferase